MQTEMTSTVSVQRCRPRPTCMRLVYNRRLKSMFLIGRNKEVYIPISPYKNELVSGVVQTKLPPRQLDFPRSMRMHRENMAVNRQFQKQTKQQQQQQPQNMVLIVWCIRLQSAVGSLCCSGLQSQHLSFWYKQELSTQFLV